MRKTVDEVESKEERVVECKRENHDRCSYQIYL